MLTSFDSGYAFARPVYRWWFAVSLGPSVALKHRIFLLPEFGVCGGQSGQNPAFGVLPCWRVSKEINF
jgi:hypothetical protein